MRAKRRGESAAVGGHGRIGFVEQIAEGLAEEGLSADDEIVDFLAEANTADRNRILDGFGKRELLQFAFVEPGDVADFVDVVVFRGHPENGDGGNSFLREFVSGLNGAEGFVEGISGTAEEADLLAANDRDGAVREAIEIFLRFGAAAVEKILRAKNVGDLSAAVQREIAAFSNSARRISDRGSVRRRVRVWRNSRRSRGRASTCEATGEVRGRDSP